MLMMRILKLLGAGLVMALLAPSAVQTATAQPNLEDQLRELVSDFEGRAGIYVRHLGKGETIEINADSLFPTASMVKVPIMAGLFDKIERGEIDYHDEWVYRDSLLYEGVDILGSFEDGEAISVSKVVLLMITASDNTASLWCQHVAGTGTAINEWLAANGFEATRVNSRTEGRYADWQRYGWGQTTPREIAELLVMIREGRAVSQAASEEMYRALTRIYWNDEALSQIPPYIQVASKQGAVDASKSEVVLVNAPSGDYVFSVITDDQTDTRWEGDNAGYVLIRDVSRMLWEYFEPDDTWVPAAGMETYYE
jgi:beta-lactamase class A